MNWKIFVLAGLALPAVAHATTTCKLMADAATGEVLVQEGQCDKRYYPMSTFKVPLALMGYDSGVLRDAHSPRLPFKKGYADWSAAWRKPADPAGWMADSVVWYSQQLTRKMGAARFGKYVQQFGYGNQDVSGDPGKHNGLTASWLQSSLQISPREQVGFLRRVVNRELGLKPHAYATTAALMQVAAPVDGWQVYGKTGSGTVEGTRSLGWYVGWMSKGERTIVFAQLAVEPDDDGKPPAGRRLRDQFLKELPGRLGALSLRGIVDSAIRPVMAAHDIPGMAVAVTLDGTPHFFNYGLASREAGTPVTEATLFELGSVSKTFTGVLAAYAQARGKLSLGDHPSRYLPQLQGSPIDQATLLQLGTYTAGGLTLQFPDNVENGGEAAYLQQWQPKFAPGVQREYSNPSIGLLGHAAALALNTGFASALETQVFPGLGLGATYVNVPASAMPDYAWGYNAKNKAVRVNPGPFDAEAYGVKSTAADMIRYVHANMEPGRLDATMRQAVDGTHIGYYDVGPMTQGLGWEQYPYPIALERLLAGNSTTMYFQPNAATVVAAPRVAPAATLFNKTGSTGGFGAYVLFVPAKKIGIVMLANRAYPIADRIKAAYAILERLAQ